MKEMLQFSTGTRQQLPPKLFEQMGHYRREVFINQLGWELNTTNGHRDILIITFNDWAHRSYGEEFERNLGVIHADVN